MQSILQVDKAVSPSLGASAKVWLALAAVYLIWGSTYLAIRAGIASLPPWLLVFGRFLLAGALASGLARFRQESRLTPGEQRLAAVSGLTLILSNGLVAVAEQTLASGLVAVVVGALPIWMLLLGWAGFGQPRPTLTKLAGALLGLAGIGLIAGTQAQGPGSLTGLALLSASSFLWACGTLLQSRYGTSASLLRFTGFQMLTGAAVAGLFTVITERPWTLEFTAIAPLAWAAVGYLALFGSLVGFTAYAWLSSHAAAPLVSTHALVNPLIAVGLGWLIYQEPVTLALAQAALLVLVSLVLLLRR